MSMQGCQGLVDGQCAHCLVTTVSLWVGPPFPSLEPLLTLSPQPAVAKEGPGGPNSGFQGRGSAGTVWG